MSLISTLSSENQFNKRIMTLPRIEHPSKLINQNDQHLLDIRGKSRDGHGNGQLIRSETTTPDLSSRRRRRRSSSLKYHSNRSNYSEQLTQIPENINTNYGQDRDQVRLPVFGRRPESTTSSYGNESGISSPQTSRIVLDELETVLREKVRSQIHDVKTKFRHISDYDSNGKISREGLIHLISSIFGIQRQIRPNQIDKLLERLHLKHLNKISFDEFLNSLFTGEEDLPGWVSRQSSPLQDYSPKRTAGQMFIILKDKIRNKNKDLIKLCPSLDGGQSSKIFKTQFHNCIIDMGYRINEKEFDKLWDKFDTDGFHAVTSEKFLKRFTNEENENKIALIPRSETQDQQVAILKAEHMRSSQTDSPIKTPHLHSGRTQLDEDQIRTWLNHKFPQGFSELEHSLERLDTKQMGILPRDRFVEELKRFGLTLERNLLDFFLKRLNIDLTLTNDFIPYKDVIQSFKQQTDPTKKRINADYTLSTEDNRQSSLEKQVNYLLIENLDKIREELNRLDNFHNETINSNDMRKLIEDLLQFPLRPDEYYQLFKQFPLDQYGKIKYNQYLKLILEKINSIEKKEEQKSPTIPQWDYMRSKNIRESLNQQHNQNKKREKSIDLSKSEQHKPRSIEQLRQMLKTLIRDRYKDIEEQFKKVDRSSYGELTQDILLDLFQNLSVSPEITRSEIVLLWSRCHLKENGNLDFYEFLREFGYRKHSSHYPNAKQNPPKKGDSDFLLTSRKLYGDSVLIHGNLINLIKSNWDILRKEFIQLDPYRTSHIQTDEFDEILFELASNINQDDLYILKNKFQTNNDSRINYVRFLKHYAPIPDLIEEIEQTNQNNVSTKNPNDLQNKLQRKLFDSSKQLRRTFKQKDLNNNGSIPVNAFKQILNDYKCYLNDEEFYSLVSQLDTKMDGNINYNYFIQHYIQQNNN